MMNLKRNEYKILDNITILYCEHKGVVHEILIDTEDLNKIQDGYGKWCINPSRSKKVNAYVQATIIGGNGKKASLHRIIMDAPPDMVVDHKDGNTFNNTKSNLRVTTQLINCRNRHSETKSKSGHTGVRWHYGDKRWRAEIKVRGKKIYLGNFLNIEDAVEARKQGELTYWGQDI